jgi:hypothetical protein
MVSIALLMMTMQLTACVLHVRPRALRSDQAHRLFNKGFFALCSRAFGPAGSIWMTFPMVSMPEFGKCARGLCVSKQSCPPLNSRHSGPGPEGTRSLSWRAVDLTGPVLSGVINVTEAPLQSKDLKG